MSTPNNNGDKISNTLLTSQEFLSELKRRVAHLDKGKAACPCIGAGGCAIGDASTTTLINILDFVEQHEDKWFDNEETRTSVVDLILASSAFKDSSIRFSTCQLLLEAATQLYRINTGELPLRRVLLVCELLLYIVRQKKEAIVVDPLAEPGSLDAKIDKHRASIISTFLALLQCSWQAIPQLLIVIMNLCYEFCQLNLLPEEQIDDLLINGLLDVVESTCYDQNDEITNAAIYLFVAIHRMLIQNDHTRLGTLSDNIILSELADRPGSSRTFGECFAFLLNREKNIAVKYMCIELLISILKSPPLSNYFYNNDRNVLLDILLQNIADLEDNSNEILILCLNTLSALIRYTDYRHYPHKLSQVRRLLRELLNTSNVSNDFHLLAREVFSDCSEALTEAGYNDHSAYS